MVAAAAPKTNPPTTRVLGVSPAGREEGGGKVSDAC